MFNKFLMTAAAVMTLAALPAVAENYGHSAEAQVEAEVAAPAQNIVDIATTNGDFSTLATALTEAGLVETIRGAENITVFAPTNEAFAKLPAGTLENLLKPENAEQLQTILKNHVVGSEIMAGDLQAGTNTVSTLAGNELNVVVENGAVTAGNATVTATDIDASNGVIHVVDQVILLD